MKYKLLCIFFLILALTIGLTFGALAEGTEDPVAAVTAQLETIDSLQQMQNNRKNYYVPRNSSLEAQEAKRSQYEEYVQKMFAARIAAQSAYDALTAEQQAQIDPDLLKKLNDALYTTFSSGEFSITERSDAYCFQAFANPAYELSMHCTDTPAGAPLQMPAIFVVVDTRESGSTWTANGTYSYGNSNYEVAYCCDVATGLENGSHYKRVNLEDSSYYGPSSARHIRAIVQNSYPFVSMSQMKANLKAGGMSSSLADQLTRADMIAGVQMAIWAYANSAADIYDENSAYGGTYDIVTNSYMDSMHDYRNESWDWWSTEKNSVIYDADAAYRVNNLVYYLCHLSGVSADEDQIVISDVEVARADLIPGTDDTYRVGMYVYLNGGSEKDDLRITITSTSSDGTVTGSTSQKVSGQSSYAMSVKAQYGDTIRVVVEGTQYVEKGVYLFEPEGGRDASQTLVSVGEGYTEVHAEESFEFHTDVEMGLRIYKTATTTDLPISDITFDVYHVVLGEDEVLNTVPTAEDVARFATSENLAGSVTTDVTGYASLPLEKGVYLVIEQHNADKVEAPVDPFFITIPMTVKNENTNGDTSTETETIQMNIVSVYPKNTPVTPPDVPPDIPTPPDNVTGHFSILKYDEDDADKVLKNAQFDVYRPATEEDSNPTIITSGGVEYAVVPVIHDGSALTLTTDANGIATSPSLPCGVYFLVETKAPLGYNRLKEAISVTVTSDEIITTKTVRIANKRGSLLPETGSVGTEWMYAAGIMMVLSAATVLITKKRMKLN